MTYMAHQRCFCDPSETASQTFKRPQSPVWEPLFYTVIVTPEAETQKTNNFRKKNRWNHSQVDFETRIVVNSHICWLKADKTGEDRMNGPFLKQSMWILMSNFFSHFKGTILVKKFFFWKKVFFIHKIGNFLRISKMFKFLLNSNSFLGKFLFYWPYLDLIDEMNASICQEAPLSCYNYCSKLSLSC